MSQGGRQAAPRSEPGERAPTLRAPRRVQDRAFLAERYRQGSSDTRVGM